MGSQDNHDNKLLKTTFLLPGGSYSTYKLLIPSKYKKTIIIITPLLKFGGEVLLHLLKRTSPSERIVLVAQHCSNAESLRAQLPANLRKRLVLRECELHSAASIRMAVLWLRVMLDRVDAVVHLVPQPVVSSVICIQRHALLSGNICSVQLFYKDILHYFGTNIRYVQVEHPFTEETENVVNRVIQECKSQSLISLLPPN